MYKEFHSVLRKNFPLLSTLTDDASGVLMGGGDKNRLAGDAVHINTCSALYVVHVDVAVFGDQIYDVVLGRHLHGDGEVVLRLGREEHVYCLLGEGLVAGGALSHLTNKL